MIAASHFRTALCLLALTLGAGAAFADPLSIQLNKAEAADKACRLTYVITNKTGVDFTDIAYVMPVYDGKGVVTAMVQPDFGALPDGATKALQFDLAATDCGAVGRISVNPGPAVCTPVKPGDAATAACAAAPALSKGNGLKLDFQ